MNRNTIKNIISECVEKLMNEGLLKESFQSKTIRNLFLKNKPYERPRYNNMWCDLSRITDDMIIGVYNNPKKANITNNSNIPYMWFGDGTVVVFDKNKLSEFNKNAENRFDDRFRNRNHKAYDENYYSNNAAYNMYRHWKPGYDKEIADGDIPYKESGVKPSQAKHNLYKDAIRIYNKKK